jgi:glycosyl transferase family 2
MTESIPLTIVARNEERAIARNLSSLLAAARFAERRLPVRIEPWLVLDRCTDRTAEIAASFAELELVTLDGPGGKIEAQRRGLRAAAFNLFSDADIEVTEETLCALCETMLADADRRLEIAFPPKQPLPPRRRTPLAAALHSYNAARGYSSQRTWFSGKLFAIRDWDLPGRAAVVTRAARLPPSRFYAFADGPLADDILLSRQCVLRRGPSGLCETAAGLIRYRAPETFAGMYAYYRRMRRELERADALFPETRDVHHRYGIRRQDLLARAPLAERLLHQIFRAALAACRVRYRCERWAVDALALTPGDAWPPVEETKSL